MNVKRDSIDFVVGRVYLWETSAGLNLVACVERIDDDGLLIATVGAAGRHEYLLKMNQAREMVREDVTDEQRGLDMMNKLSGRRPPVPGRNALVRNRRRSPTALQAWQTRLHANFTGLQARKAGASPNVPLGIYALEHQLNPTELEELGTDLTNYFKRTGHIGDDVPLPWIVYACEKAIKFEGTHYWPFIEEQFPRWRNTNRGQLRDLFLEFNRGEFQGAMPVPGKWSDHFNIMALPITHSILPLGYQLKLAVCVDSLGGDFGIFENLFDDASLLQALKAEAEKQFPNDRFVEFIDGNLLIAEIVWSFFGDTGKSQQIDDMAFSRIIQEFQRTFEGREIQMEPDFNDARIIKDYLKGKYRGKIDGPGDLMRDASVEKTKALTDIGITISLKKSTDVWDVEVSIPCLDDWLTSMMSAGEVDEEILDRAALVINGGNRSRRLRTIQRGSQTYPLANWPDLQQPLCMIEPSPRLRQEQVRLINRFLQTLSPKVDDLPILFRVVDDHTRGTFVPSKKIRPGGTYIVLGPNSTTFDSHESLALIKKDETININGIESFLLQIPVDLTNAQQESLREMGLTLAQNFYVGPVGMMGLTQNKSDLMFDWLAGQSLVMSMRSDSPYDDILLSDKESPGNEIVLTPDEDNRVLFVVPTDEPGPLNYRFAIRKDGAFLDEDVLGINVRDPVYSGQWLDSPRHSIQVVLEPTEFHSDGIRLEDFWGDQVLLEVRGVEGIPIDCEVTLLDGGGMALGGPILIDLETTPVSTDRWSESFNRRVTTNPEVMRLYGRVDSISITIDAGERGRDNRTFFRRVPLIRWKFSESGSGVMLYLEGEPDTPNLRTYRIDFKEPLTLKLIPDSTRFFEDLQPVESGLYIAKWGDSEYSVVAVPIAGSLPDDYLQADQIAKHTWDGSLDVLNVWVLVPIYGDVSLDQYRQRVITQINQSIRSSLVDNHSATIVSELQNEGTKLAASSKGWLQLLPKIEESKRLHLFNAAANSQDLEIPMRVNHFLSAITDLALISDQLVQDVELFWDVRRYFERDKSVRRLIAEFALRAVNAPDTLLSWSGQEYETMADNIKECPDILGSAQFFCIRWNFHHSRSVHRSIPAEKRPAPNLTERWQWI